MEERYTHRHAIEQWKHYAADQSGYISDDTPFSNKSILFNLLEIRSQIIRDSLKMGEDLSESMSQIIPCIELVEVDRNECPVAPASGCYWFKSKEPIPRYIKAISVTGTSVSESNPRFTFMKWDRLQYIPIARASSMRNGYFWTVRDTGTDGPHLYLYGSDYLELASMAAIWEKPYEAATFPGCKGTGDKYKCNPLDVAFHTDSWMIDNIISQSWQKLLTVKGVAGLDIQNDDTHGNNAVKNR